MPLFLPSHRYEVRGTGLRRRPDWSKPSLSKSAPCNCCQSTPCSRCFGQLQSSFTLDDTDYGTTTMSLSGGIWSATTTYSTTLAPTCGAFVQAGTHTITYTLHCDPDLGDLYMLATFPYCYTNYPLCTGNPRGIVTTGPCTRTETSTHVPIPADCTLDSTGITFEINADMSDFYSIWPFGGSWTIHT